MDVAEHLAARELNNRVFAWELVETAAPARHLETPMQVIGRIGLSVHLQAVRTATAIVVPVLLLSPAPIWLAATAALLGATAQILVHKRLVFGLDGADQMGLIVWAGITIAALSPTAGLVLIAGQSILSYLTAGIAKLFGSEWRSGVAPRKIAQTVSHGSNAAAMLLSYPKVSFVAAWGTIVFETLMPGLVLLGTPTGGLCFVAAAVFFHLAVAWAMGLNNFVWSFTSALPAVYFASQFFN